MNQVNRATLKRNTVYTDADFVLQVQTDGSRDTDGDHKIAKLRTRVTMNSLEHVISQQP